MGQEYAFNHSYFTDGYSYLEEGNVIKAMQIWEDARSEITDNDEIDLRIGTHAMDVVMEQDLYGYYPLANKLFYWSLNASDFEKNREAIKKLKNQISVLMNSEQRERLEENFEASDSNILKEIKNFWISRDPDVTDEFNIRLIEHWQRLNYVQENFTLRSNTKIGTDDRGPVFLKYGEPDHIEEGILQFNNRRVQSWIRELVQLEKLRNRESRNLGSRQEMANTFLTSNISQFFDRPFYAIWVYESLDGESLDNSLIFIFGEDGNTHQFRELHSLDQLIPDKAYRGYDNLSDLGVSPSMFLQMMIYDRFSIVDRFFSEAFSEMQSAMFTIENRLSPQLSKSLKSTHESKISARQSGAPPDASDYLGRVSGFDTEVKQYRLMDEDGIPCLATFLFTNIFSDNHVEFNSTEINSVKVRAEIVEEGIVNVYRNNRDLKRRDSLDVFHVNVPHTGGGGEQNFKLNLFREPINGQQSVASHTGYSNAKSVQPEVLFFDEGTDLKVSDLILGYRKSENGPFNNDFFNFNLDPENRIPEGNDMAFYLETRNLQVENGISRFSIHYSISKKGRRVLFFRFPERSQFSYEVFFEIADSHYSDPVIIESDNLRPGRFTLQIVVEDKLSGEKIERETEFEVYEP